MQNALETIARAWFPAGRQAIDLRPALSELKMPVQLIWGRDDRLVPSSHATILERLLPHVQVQVWDDCGHLPQIEHSTQFNKAALAFWGGLSRNER